MLEVGCLSAVVTSGIMIPGQVFNVVFIAARVHFRFPLHAFLYGVSIVVHLCQMLFCDPAGRPDSPTKSYLGI